MYFDPVKVSLNGLAISFKTFSANCEGKLRHLLKTYLLSTLTMCPQIFYICEVGKIGKYLILSKGIKATFFVVKTKKNHNLSSMQRVSMRYGEVKDGIIL